MFRLAIQEYPFLATYGAGAAHIISNAFRGVDTDAENLIMGLGADFPEGTTLSEMITGHDGSGDDDVQRVFDVNTEDEEAGISDEEPDRSEERESKDGEAGSKAAGDKRSESGSDVDMDE